MLYGKGGRYGAGFVLSPYVAPYIMCSFANDGGSQVRQPSALGMAGRGVALIPLLNRVLGRSTASAASHAVAPRPPRTTTPTHPAAPTRPTTSLQMRSATARRCLPISLALGPIAPLRVSPDEECYCTQVATRRRATGTAPSRRTASPT